MSDDPLTPEQRYRSMSANKGRDTKPELHIRKGLWQRGYRYQTNVKVLPGKPDIVLKKHGAVIFVHGWFWHQREHCYHGYTPKSRVEFWSGKFKRNAERDVESRESLLKLGWRVSLRCGSAASRVKQSRIFR